MNYLPPTSHVTLLATLRRERRLPVAGEVLVRSGQRVEAMDVVGRAMVPDEHRIKDLARDLGVPPAKAGAFLTKQEGEPVKKGEAIAVRKSLLGLARRESRSTVDGTLVVSAGGKVLLAVIARPYELRAGLPGTVTRVVESHSLTIETTGALLEGVWGNGRETFGLLRAIGAGPHDALKAEQIELGLRGSMLAVGCVADNTAFEPLAKAGIRGLIAGTVRAELLPQLQKLDLPVLVVEGFGTQGFSAPAYDLLSGNNGREVWINAAAWNRYRGDRPEAIIPLPGPGQAPPPPAAGQLLAAGKRVRIRRGPLTGQSGVVTALRERAQTLPSGVRSRVAAVELDEARGKPVEVAFANLEILE